MGVGTVIASPILNLTARHKRQVVAASIDFTSEERSAELQKTALSRERVDQCGQPRSKRLLGISTHNPLIKNEKAIPPIHQLHM